MLEIKSAELIQNLNEMIKKYAGNDKIRKSIIEQFTNRNMKASLAINILNERLLLSTLDVNDAKDLILLFVFSTGMYKAITDTEIENNSSNEDLIKIFGLDPIDYFTEIEVEHLKDYKLDKIGESVEDEPIVFPNMIQIADNFWVGGISSQQFADLDAGNEFIYNFKTQRDPVFDVYGMKKISLSKTKVKEIVEGLLSGEQFPDAIVVNVLHDGTDEVRYSKNGDLTIVSGVKNIVDGQHRKVSNSIFMEKVKEKNEEVVFNWVFIVTNYSEAKAQKQMVQINKQKPMKVEHIKNLDKSKLGNNIVDIIKDGDSEFARMIRDSDIELEHGGLCKKATISISIDECYKSELTNRLQIKQIALHIANVLDYVIGLNVDQFINYPEQTRKVSYINHKNMFLGYVALSAKLYKDKNWEEKIEGMLNKVDFSIQNGFWIDNDIKEHDVKKASRNNFYKLFSNL